MIAYWLHLRQEALSKSGDHQNKLSHKYSLLFIYQITSMREPAILNNPVKDCLLVKVETHEAQHMQYIIADIHGCEVCTGRHKDQTGIIPIDVDFLKRGMYMLFLVSETAYYLQTFIKS